MSKDKENRNVNPPQKTPVTTPSIPLLDKESRAVSFNDILEGNVRIDMFNGVDSFIHDLLNDFDDNDLEINWNDETKIINDINSARDKVLSKMQEEFSELLKKEPSNWNEEERDEWSSKLAFYTSAELDNHPIFSKYKLDGQGKRERRINDINEKSEFDCECMAIIEGIIMQLVENEVLKSYAKDYYLVTGQANYNYGAGFAKHTWVMNEDGDVFEATADKEGKMQDLVFRKNVIDSYTFKHFIAGFPSLVEDKNGRTSYYGTRGFSGEEESVTLVNERYEYLRNEDIETISASSLKKLEEIRILSNLSEGVNNGQKGFEWSKKIKKAQDILNYNLNEEVYDLVREHIKKEYENQSWLDTSMLGNVMGWNKKEYYESLMKEDNVENLLFKKVNYEKFTEKQEKVIDDVLNILNNDDLYRFLNLNNVINKVEDGEHVQNSPNIQNIDIKQVNEYLDQNGVLKKLDGVKISVDIDNDGSFDYKYIFNKNTKEWGAGSEVKR